MTLREKLIASGAVRPTHSAKPKPAPRNDGWAILSLDARGIRMAAKHIADGQNGALIMAIPSGLAPWHEAALLKRERRMAQQGKSQ